MKQNNLSVSAQTDANKYKVFKVMRKSHRQTTIARNLTLEEAQRLVQSFPDSNRSMVCYARQ